MPLVGLQDTYRVVLHGLLDGQQISNVFHYHRSSVVGSAVGLANTFLTDVVPTIRNVVSSAVLYTNIVATNIEDPDDTADIIANLVGNRTSDFVSTFASWGMRMYPSVASIQTGSKRFAGVCEADVDEGVATTLQALRLALLAVKLAQPIAEFLTVYTPAIYSDRVVLGIPFRRVATVSSVAYNWMTTQNSRKAGRGA